MSFLNPVSEPALVFRSTDTGAPQINYAARAAGDVKAVLKACLVTGYSTKASAGWSIMNEVDHVAEFASPSVAISDYRLKISDGSTAATAWNYYYQDVLANPPESSINKVVTGIITTSPKNRWQLIVTERGFWFVEMFAGQSYQPMVMCRATYFGAVKSAINDASGNISFWTVGYNTPSNTPFDFFTRDAYPAARTQKIGNYSNTIMGSVLDQVYKNPVWNTTNNLAVISPLYIYQSGVFLAEHPGIYTRLPVQGEDVLNCFETTADGRPMLQLCLSHINYSIEELRTSARFIMIPLDNWDY